MTWDDETIRLLRTLWAEGHSTSEIGRRLHTSKNAVVGKAHRLDLDARPSPIKGRVSKISLPDVPSIPRKVHTLPPLASEAPPPAPMPEPALKPAPDPAPTPTQLVAVVPAPQTATIELFRTIASVPLKIVHEEPAAPEPVVKQIAKPRIVPTCCWPTGEPGKPGFRFCDAPAIYAKPYCAEHTKRAYVRIRDRSEDATV